MLLTQCNPLCLSPSSIIWYWPNGSDALWLGMGRWPQACWREPTASFMTNKTRRSSAWILACTSVKQLRQFYHNAWTPRGQTCRRICLCSSLPSSFPREVSRRLSQTPTTPSLSDELQHQLHSTRQNVKVTETVDENMALTPCYLPSISKSLISYTHR